MEEVIAKSAKTLYIVTYSIFLVFGIIVVGLGALLVALVGETEPTIFGGVLIGLGAIIIIAGVAWLVYFTKMPSESDGFVGSMILPRELVLKDGKLYFRNGIVCVPTEVDYCKVKGMGLDGAMFDFGKLLISVNGKEFKLNFVCKTTAVVNRLFMLKAQGSVQANIASKQNAESGTPVSAEEKTSEEK